MPLPTGNPEWPPPSLKPALDLYERYGAWYSGDADKLSKVYASTLGTTGSLDPKALVRPAQYQGGLIGLAARSFWGTPPPAGSLKLAKLHVPLASDIAMTSADLLFAEPPDITVEDETAQTRLEEIIDVGGLLPVLIEGAEICAAYGGVYLRAGWDPQVADHVLADAIPPDAAVPEWRSGRLVAVTFWREVGREAGKVLRHLERHEPGRIFHALYRGDDERLGTQAKLQDHPETEAFAALVGPGGYVETGADDALAVEYVPNMRPNRVLRGSQLGRSDYAGIEPMFDALDETWTSWMRDIRIGKGRIVVPDIYLTSAGRGRGAIFDAEQEVYQAVNALPGADSGLAMQVVQFAIRVIEHQTTATDITAQAVRGAGYSVQTFGEAGEVAITATEVVAKQQRTMQTRGRKIGYWRPALRRFVRTMLRIDAAKFASFKAEVELPALEWPDAVADGPQALAQTLQLLKAAEAISRKTAVTMLHPDWDETAVDEEVKLIGDDLALGEVPPPGEGDVPGGSGGSPDDDGPFGS